MLKLERISIWVASGESAVSPCRYSAVGVKCEMTLSASDLIIGIDEWGLDEEAVEKVLASGGSYDPNAPFSDYSITLYRDIVRAVQTLGYSWVERSYPNTDSGFTDGIALIESEIRNGRPVLADVTAPEGHTFVVSGFDTIARKLLVTDPNRPAPGQRWLGYEKFQAIWNERAYGGDFRSLVTTQAKTGP